MLRGKHGFFCLSQWFRLDIKKTTTRWFVWTIKGPKASSDPSGLGGPWAKGSPNLFLIQFKKNLEPVVPKTGAYPSTGRSSQAFSRSRKSYRSGCTQAFHGLGSMAGIGCSPLDQREELGLLTMSVLFEMLRVFGSFLFSAPRVTSSIYLH